MQLFILLGRINLVVHRNLGNEGIEAISAGCDGWRIIRWSAV